MSSELDESSVTVPTEIYSLANNSKQPNGTTSTTNLTTLTNDKILERAFGSLACSETVRLGLDHDEEQLFDTLLNTTLAYERGEISLDDDKSNSNDKDDKTESLQIRVAGGWVRDKILGLRSHDVDITVDKMMGVQFATLIQKYLLSLPLSHPARCQSKYPKMGVIAANPEQSKHLETATMKVHNIDIDVCHLRAEEIYQENSRIPTVSIGTPLQDAQRRDFTLNAMFYNLKTKLVEDWTQRGMQDLRHRRLVTPLNAETTFQDDPLRVLRAIRFAVRYQLELDEGLKKACMLPIIHKALQVKVSRERVGKELEGMLSGKGANPQKALETIGQLKLAGCVFCFPAAGEVINKTQTSAAHGQLMGHEYNTKPETTSIQELEQLRELGWEESQRLLAFLPPLYQLAEQQLPPTTSFIDKRLFPLAVFLLPFRFLKYEEKKTGNSNSLPKEFPLTMFMFRESIKFKNKDVQSISVLMENVSSMVKFLTELAEQQQVAGAEQAEDALQVCRLEAGLILRATKELWVTTLFLAALIKMREQQQQQQSNTDDDGATTATTTKVDWLKLTAAAYKTILELNLEECWKAKPLLNGKAVVEALKLPRGPIISTYLEEQARWMLLNPDGTKEECEAHLHSVKRQRDADASDDGGGGNPRGQHPRLK
ncbi:Putative CCA tRNA nucleotidyltransferase 2 [Seminavis robusta]|uniref:CCA tRNA nucleotidyltransferase 2 n=1 Tax=Seminavis robusta TaxID=568900 RepID=A0A9N8HRQ4_9STRA|nr:Putative CCA tRNA nucleotidyltransferase 2 [Seminavis robusta]|eukprot:Sro1347_g264930.1 Putative CCA tRNA nucleotidyltransferase 2 (656) ;mRNA; r:21397-23364